MRRRRLGLLPHLRQQNMHLLLTPAIPVTQQTHREGLEAIEHLDQVAGTHFFEDGILGPHTQGELEFLDGHVLEPGVFNPPFQTAAGTGGAADAVGDFEEFVTPYFGGVIGFQRAVLRVKVEVVILEFRPAAGTEIAIFFVSNEGYFCHSYSQDCRVEAECPIGMGREGGVAHS